MSRTIIPAVIDDKDEILALYKSVLYGPADWDENYPSEETIDFDLSRNALFVMKNDNGEIISAISIDDDEIVENLDCWGENTFPVGEFSRICVREDMRNQGIATEMIRYVFDVLRSQGKKGVHILVRPGHQKAIKLYTSLGFKTVGECHVYDKDYICMEMCL